MASTVLTRTWFVWPLVVAAILLILVIGVGSAVHPSGVAFLGVMVWLLVVGALGTAIYLFVRAQRWAAAVGVLVVGASIRVVRRRCADHLGHGPRHAQARRLAASAVAGIHWLGLGR